MDDPLKKNAVKEVLDKAKTKAFQRAEDKPNWDDVWLSLAEHSDFAKVLAERGVMVSSFRSDLDYISKFGLKNDTAGFSSAPKQSTIERVCADLQQTLEGVLEDGDDFERGYDVLDRQFEDGDLADAADAKREKKRLKREATQEMVAKLSIELAGVMRDSKNAEDPKYVAAKQMIITMLVRKLAEQGGSSMGGLLGGDDEKLLALTLQKLLISMPMLLEQDDGAIMLLEELANVHPLQRPSALEVMDIIMSASPDVYSKLLYRNGLLTKDTGMTDELADRFPSRFVQRLSLQALDVAYRAGSKTVDSRHMVTALMAEPELQMHLHDLGIKDLLEFSEKYTDRAFKEEQDDESTIRVHPQITPEFLAYTDELDQFVKDHKKDDHLPSKIFRRIFKDDQSIDKDLNKAGLLRRMSRGWAKPYKEDEKAKAKNKDDDKEDKKKKEKVFEISDQELEDLIAEYCVDYTRLATQKKFDPMIGNEKAMEEVETTLLKRGKKNPLVIGEPGIGKTKILEGFAQRIVSGKVPKKLIGSRLLSLDLHSINTSPFVGIFESRILPILKGVSERNASGRFPPVQLAIDEFANAMDAGAHSKGEGIKGMIKPYLTSGDLFVIGTTTMDEYQTKVQKDGALTRRFNPVILRPPSEEEAANILKQLKSKYSRHHGLRIPNHLCDKAANFAERYIHQVNHPDKSIDLLDLACAMAVKAGDKSLDEKHLVKAASSMSGVPEDFLNKEDKQRYVNLPNDLGEAVLDQPDAIKAVSASLQRAKAGLRSNPEAPIGTFLFVGPTGVGKTELTRALARQLYGSEDFLIRFDMSEFMEKQSAGRLIGSDPGYVGYEEGGALVKEVREKPYSVILYDEIEKAHPDVFNVLLRPFDSGMVTDGRGVSANMRNTINVMTSNLGAKEVMEQGRRMGLDPLKDQAEWQKMAMPIYKHAVETFFKPEFLNRLDGVVYFNSLSKDTIELLVDRQITQAKAQIREHHHGLDFELSEDFRKAVAATGFDIRFGARPLKRAFQDIVSTPLAGWLLGQNDRALKKAGRIIVSPAMELVDEETRIEEALAAAQPGDDIAAVIQGATQELQPVFKLGPK